MVQNTAQKYQLRSINIRDQNTVLGQQIVQSSQAS